ncbi:ester cyclase [Variovorax sp. 38R]|nr:ester cyclase [Variovorax sp. 38R]
MEHTPMTTLTDLQARRERLVLDHFADETRQDFDAVLGTFPHPHYELIPSGEVHDGIADVRQYYTDTRRAFPDQRHEIIQLRHADDSVIVEFWLLGTHRGPLKGLPPTGNSFRCRMNAFFIFEGDRLVCERVYFDTLTMLRQLLVGVPPEMVGGLVAGLLGQSAPQPEAAAA